MDAGAERLITAIHASGRQMVLEFAGAGSAALAALHGVAGSSRTILEATDRYSTASLTELLGPLPAKIVDPATAAAMADRAYLRAHRLGDDERTAVGVACTATIAADRAQRGDHRCCVAVKDQHRVSITDLVLTKEARDRAAEEAVVTAMLLQAIAAACDIPAPGPLLAEGERIETTCLELADPLAANARWTCIDASGKRTAEAPVAGIVYSGSFNPLHYGHEALAAAAARFLNEPTVFELSSVNAEKAPLGRGEVERRLAQFWRRYPVIVSRTPLFWEKAELYPGCTFLLGYDTTVRLIDERFYGDSAIARDRALDQIAAHHCRVLVAGRVEGGVFKTLQSIPLPRAHQDMFIELPEGEFRADISASECRGRVL